ncbi:hypothetical protein HUJ04_008079 [Dendroctonus ponderosae]|nr:hypothetical protein HUJ04_008079 [Dendroctonus ponderosae]
MEFEWAISCISAAISPLTLLDDSCPFVPPLPVFGVISVWVMVVSLAGRLNMHVQLKRLLGFLQTNS